MLNRRLAPKSFVPTQPGNSSLSHSPDCHKITSVSVNSTWQVLSVNLFDQNQIEITPIQPTDDNYPLKTLSNEVRSRDIFAQLNVGAFWLLFKCKLALCVDLSSHHTPIIPFQSNFQSFSQLFHPHSDVLNKTKRKSGRMQHWPCHNFSSSEY